MAVKNIIKSTGSGAWYGPLPGLVGSDSPFPTREEQLALLSEFWAAWDEEADVRAQLLKSRCVKWDMVAESLMRSNQLLKDCPDARLRRAVRLSRLPLDTPLTIEDTWIYVMVGAFLPYVGQVGFLQGPRAPLERYKEHLSRAKSLRNLFLGNRHRRMRCQLGFGKTPSLSRVLARVGGHQASMVLLQKVDPPREAFNVESHFDSVLAPTLNQIDPARGWGIGELRWRWSLREETSSEAKTLSQRVNDVLWKVRSSKDTDQGVEDLLDLLTSSLGKIPGRLFDSFFRAVQGVVKRMWGVELQRRFIVRVPTYHRHTINGIKRSLRSQIAQHDVPQTLKAWLSRALSVLPLQAHKLKDVFRGGAALRTVRMTADELVSGIKLGTYDASPFLVGGQQRAWVFKEPSEVQPRVVQEIQRQLARRQGRRCTCAALMRQHPALRNDLGHVVLRTRSQWACLFSDEGADTLSSNARQCVIPSIDVLAAQMELFQTSLQRMTVPAEGFLPSASGISPSLASASLSLSQIPPSLPTTPASSSSALYPPVSASSLLSGDDIAPIVEWVHNFCLADISAYTLECPTLGSEHVSGLSKRIWDLRFRAGIWDKQLHRMSGACRVLEEDHVVGSYLGGDRFILWGVAESKAAAQAANVYDTLTSAQAHGIVDCAIHHNLLRKGYADLSWAATHINSVYTDPEPPPSPGDTVDLDPGPQRQHQRPLFGAPSIFSILKWKTVERGAQAIVKWRDIVSFKLHILRSYARLMSRSLQLIVSEVYRQFQTLGMPSMVGVRDLLGSLGRFNPVWASVRPDEADMTDMFWNIPKGDVVPALHELFELLEGERRGCAEFFALHKSGEKALDRLGTASSADFRVISRQELLDFVSWDLHHNTGLVLGPLLLKQGDRGVPIGGHLSAQLAELWALARELKYIFGEHRSGLVKTWDQTVRKGEEGAPASLADIRLCVREPIEVCHPSCRGSQKLGRVLGSTDRPFLHSSTLRTDGFGGWWGPTDASFGYLDVDGVQVDLLVTSLWDGAPDGRMGTVIASAPPRDRARLREFFRELDPMDFVVSEARRGWWGWATRPSDPAVPISTSPGILFSRFRDNIYIIFMNIHPALFPRVRHAAKHFLDCLYGVPLKWEPTDLRVSWGECSWKPLPLGFSLTRKGVIWDIAEGAELGEWLRWVPARSANASFTLASMLPSLFLKSLWYAGSTADVQANFRSLLWGVGWHSYPKHWWLPCLTRFLRKYNLLEVFSLGSVTTWVREGKRAAATSGSGVVSSQDVSAHAVQYH